MPKTKTLILGAGLSGLSAAYHLKKDYLIFEKEKEAGGLCRSYEEKGWTFDYDGHLLHFRNKNIYNFVRSLLNDNITCHKRNSFIKYQGYEIPYPFQLNFIKLPGAVACECLKGLKKAQNSKHKKPCIDFKQWVYSNFGPGIARHFMIPYNEKFWTIPLENLNCQWLDGFIPVLKYNEILKTLEGAEGIGYNAHFFYPKRGGINQLVKALENLLSQKVVLNSMVTAINPSKKEIIINNTDKYSYDNIISSIPLPELNSIIPGLPNHIKAAFDKLNYNSLLVLNIGLNKPGTSDKHWIYFPEEKYHFFRVGHYNSFSTSLAPEGKSSIYAEYAFKKNSALKLNSIKKAIINQLIEEGLIGNPDEIACARALVVKYAYPIYDRNYEKSLTAICSYLRSCNIAPIGRYGSWKYMTMEDAIIDGKKISAGIPY